MEVVKSPFWETTKPQVVRALDAVFDPERYKTVFQYRDTLIETARKNPDEMAFYLRALMERIKLVEIVIADSKLQAQEVIKTDG